MDVKGRTLHYKKMLETKFDSLPDDAVFDILVRIPAQDIYNAARLVCRKCYHMINSPNFIYSHLRRHSTCGLLIQNPCDQKRPPTFVAMRKGRIEISKLSYEYVKFILSSCDGLVLESRRNCFCCDLYDVTNPATKVCFALPKSFITMSAMSCAIAYAPTSMAYKVVHLFYDTNSRSSGCAMLTLGVDKSWRRIVFSQHLSEKAKRLLGCKSLTIEGFVIWAEKSNVLMYDVETEIFTQIHVPQIHGERLGYYYMSAGRYLSLLIKCTEFSWEVWKMKPETGEWTKLPNINFGARKGMFEQICLKRNNFLNFKLTPVGWLIYPEVLVFSAYEMGKYVPRETGLCIACNVHTQEIESFELDTTWNNFFAHKHRLLSLNGC